MLPCGVRLLDREEGAWVQVLGLAVISGKSFSLLEA